MDGFVGWPGCRVYRYRLVGGGMEIILLDVSLSGTESSVYGVRLYCFVWGVYNRLLYCGPGPGLGIVVYV